MLTVTGTAEFAHDGNLIVRVAIQPHVPHEHDLLTKVAVPGFSDMYMLNGQLILVSILGETQRNLVKDLEQTPSSAPSDATSVSDPCGARMTVDGVPDEQSIFCNAPKGHDGEHSYTTEFEFIPNTR